MALRGLGYSSYLVARWQNIGIKMGRYTVGEYVDTDDDILLRARNYGPKAHDLTVAMRNMLDYSDHVAQRIDHE